MVTAVAYVSLSILAFSVAHSLLASHFFKNRVSQVVGKRFYNGWYRALYNLISLFTLLPVLYFLAAPSPVLWQTTGIGTLFFNFIRIIAVIGALCSLAQIDWLAFMGIRQIVAYYNNHSTSEKNEILITTGLYKFTRHPLYFFSLLYIWFAPLMSTSWFFFSIGTTLYFLIGSYFEERKMLTLYGDRYKSYIKEVPWLIPFTKIARRTSR